MLVCARSLFAVLQQDNVALLVSNWSANSPEFRPKTLKLSRVVSSKCWDLSSTFPSVCIHRHGNDCIDVKTEPDMPSAAVHAARALVKRTRRGLYAGKTVLSGNSVSEDGGNRCTEIPTLAEECGLSPACHPKTGGLRSSLSAHAGTAACGSPMRRTKRCTVRPWTGWSTCV